MQIIYAQQPFPNKVIKSIFLAGPTPRTNDIISWRKEALKILEKLNYDGTVFVPEASDSKFYDNYNNQVEWEHEGLQKCDCIVFWIPRSVNLPGFTTNIELGLFYKSGKVVFGFPNDTPHTHYIDNIAKRENIKVYDSLQETLSHAINYIGEGSLRENGETHIPIRIWQSDQFQEWYNDLKNHGNKLVKAEQKFIHFVKNTLFSVILHVEIYISDENRIKENEFVIFRKSICSAILYNTANKIEDYEFVIIKEFRSPVSNNDEYVYELPGGSSFNDKLDLEIISDEIHEETSLDIAKDRIKLVDQRQMASTLCSHKCTLYSVELTQSEIDSVKEIERTNRSFGVECDSENTYLRVYKLKDIINNKTLDYSNIGMLLDFVYKIR